MISSAKMSKATREIKRLLPFRTQLETIIGNLLEADAEFTSPLSTVRPLKHLTVVVTGSDDGLCGAYNVNIIKHLLQHINTIRDQYGKELTLRIVPVGNKMQRAAAKLAGDGIEVETPEGITAKSDADAVKRLTAGLQADFLAGRTDRVDVIYMHFISAGRQRLSVRQILPVAPVSADNAERADAANANGLYIYEPDAQTIFATALPLLLLSQMQEIFCENRASEQAARVMAMQSANDNASKLLEQLQLEYNKLRQQSITAELLDILGGQVK